MTRPSDPHNGESTHTRPAVPYTVIESVKLSDKPEHIHMLILTKEYGLCAVCSLDGEWLVQIVEADKPEQG